jgi:Flp pilus assembly protein TadG
MKPPMIFRPRPRPHSRLDGRLISRLRSRPAGRSRERGVTLVLVAVAMVAMIAMAALSIDLVTLYLDREEAQRSADLAALTAARVLSLSGATGDPANAQSSWTTICPVAQQAATTIANQNNVAQTAPTSVVVTFLYNGGAVDCSAPSAGFTVNPQVQVQVIRQSLPVFFSRIWSRATNSVSATAVAEAYNPSGSGGLGSGMVPVSPRCVKPWIVPNVDPDNQPKHLVNDDGTITNTGISLNGTSTGGVIGETFTMFSSCGAADCTGMENTTPGVITKNGITGVQYIPALVSESALSVAVPSCANSAIYQQGAMAGCDQTTNYACGIPSGGVQSDLTQTPLGVNGTSSAAQCLIHQAGNGNTTGEDSLDTSVFPFQIKTGDNNPMFGVGLVGTVVSVSNSIITVPIFDGAALPNGNTQPPVNIVGFLQLFIDSTDSSSGTINTHVLNVAGCSTNATNSAVNGSSPVPVRLITPQ